MKSPTDDGSPFHAGEQTVQAYVGVRERSEQLGRRMIRSFLPDPHRALLAELPYLVIGSLDASGNPWASMLFGEPGFVRSPDPHHLWIARRPAQGDPLAAALTLGAPLGVLGIQLHTRRRNRVNGRIDALDASGFGIEVAQSFGNCPMYIAARETTPSSAPQRDVRAQPEGHALSAEARACIAHADTCFIASASSRTPARGEPSAGVDVSHRGGKPGFVRVRDDGDDTVLTLPDFAGNNAFNTLGNLQSYPRAGLAFPRFDTGALLLVSGAATVVFDGPELAHFAGAERLVHVRVRHAVLLHDALPPSWSTAEPAPQTARTGVWSDSKI